MATTHPKQKAGKTARRLPAARLWIFRSIAIALAFLLLVVIELSLRLFHYGYDTSLFIEAPGNKEYLIFNPDASRRYFTDQLYATTGNREPFRKVKEAGTLRIFVLGESTTIGYPYFHNGSFHRWLQYRLMRSFPDKKLEIINLSLTAVNSYTVLGFAREAVRYEPDAILIYTGHNEYYGALGVGSTERLGGSPWLVNTLLWLRQLRVVQLLTQVCGKIAHLFSSGASRSGKTRMELMVADQRITYGSPLFDRGIRQFETNMDETLEICHRHGIPVFISNLVSNLKDQRPFISVRPGNAAADSVDALYDYTLGGRAWAHGDFGAAKEDYTRAKEMDALRFRAPERLNDIIAGFCRKYDNVHLVDTHAAFEAASDHGIIGKSLLLEHVHPNLTGYALLSDVFYRALQQQGLIPQGGGKEMSFRQLLAEMPLTRVDSLAGAYKIANLENNWPFSDSGRDAGPPSRDALHLSTEEEDLAYAVAFEHLPWEEAMRQLYDYYSKTEDWAKAATVMEALCLEHPSEAAWYEKTAMLYGKLDENDKAILYFGQAFSCEPTFERAHYLFVLCLRADRPAEAMPYLDYAIANNSAGMNLVPVRDATMEIMRLERQLAKDPANTALVGTISRLYLQMGNKPAALKYSSLAGAHAGK
ncbi:MAG TPA: GDSL-type esterase/lipase family protein [Puia sp.]|nr:GDSL-type esterase/lipase family protein [Puia sp.]